jgi:hypothetical protein
MSAMLKQEEAVRRLKGVPASFRGLQINHLFFADDNFLFCKAIEREWNGMKNVLGAYEGAPGQRLNDEKTFVFFS